MRVGKASGCVFHKRGRDRRPSPIAWIKWRLMPGMPWRYESTKQPDDDEAERRLAQRLGEDHGARLARMSQEKLTVNDLLDLLVLHYQDEHRTVPPGHVEAFRFELGAERAVDVTEPQLDALCRRWRKDGIVWPQRETDRVRPATGSTCNRYLATLRRAYNLGRRKFRLVTPLTFPHFEERSRGEYLPEDDCRRICDNFRAKVGARVKADVFRLGYLLGVRKGQLRATLRSNVVILGRRGKVTALHGDPGPDIWKLCWTADQTKNGEPHEVLLHGEAREIVERAWADEAPGCAHLFHVKGKPLGRMRSEVQRTCAALGIPYGRGKGIVWHDTRHSAVTNLVAAGVPEAIAMTVTGHKDPAVFKRYNVRRDDVQADALARQEAYLARQRTKPTPESRETGTN